MLKRFLLTGIAIVLSLLLAANPAIADPSIPATASKGNRTRVIDSAKDLIHERGE
ncbi:MAG: hypothetical protein GYA80_03155 [Chloroflexi bacterium]|nr:hypothetical protein [Chloroflexota bacterium]